MSLLQMSNISAFYGPSQALFDVSLELDEGEVLALMGRNGMGKTTTVKVICRLLRHRDGSVAFAGQNLAGVPAHKAARAGLGLVPEGRRCFGGLSVRENLIAAARKGPWTQGRIYDLFPALGERQQQGAASLSGGEQQMLAIGRALMTNPRLLILDEATEGLAPVIRQQIWSVVRRIKADTGMAILVVDKSLKEMATVADRAVILEKGRSEWEGPFADVTPEIAERYLGV